MQYWRDTWKWDAGDFRPPHYFHESKVYDLRSLADQAVPGVTAGKFVLCAAPVLGVGPDVVPIGETGSVLTPGVRAELSSWLGEAVPAITTGAFIERLLVNMADPTGQARWMPERVGRGMRLAFKCGDVVVDRRVQQADSEWLQTLAVERANYARWRGEVVAGRMKPGQHLKALGGLVRKYGVSYHEFRGALPDEGVLVPATTVADSFDRADNADLNASNSGKTTDGAPATWTWTEVTANQDIVLNRMQNTGAAAWKLARCDQDLSSDDHYCQVKVNQNAQTNLSAYPVIRKDSTATLTYYVTFCYDVGATDALQTYKRIAGTHTLLRDSAQATVDNDTVRIEMDNTTIKVRLNGTQVGADITGQTDISGNLRVACGSEFSGNYVNDFEGGDNAAGAGIGRQMQQHGLYAGRS